MNFPKYIPGDVDYWAAALFTEFVNGFISGLGSGSIVGMGVGATTATTDLGASLSPLKQLMISAASLVLTAAGNGLKRAIIWHDKNPFPNPWPKPANNPPTT